MASILERATSHYKQLAQTPQQIEVSEWKDDNGNPCILTWTPMTPKERVEIDAMAKNPQEIAVCTCIVKCRDENGDRVFKRVEKSTLMREVDSSVLERIASAIIGVDEDILEDYEKN